MDKSLLRVYLIIMVLVVMCFAPSISANEQSENYVGMGNVYLPIRGLIIGKDLRNSEIDIESYGESVVFVDDDADSGWYDSTHVATIQEGLSNATQLELQIVFVYNGYYYGKITINNPIKLIGEDKDETIIDCQRSNKNSKEGFITIKADNVRISDFTVKNGWIKKPGNYNVTSYLIKIDENVKRCDISNNIIEDCYTAIILSDNNKYCKIYDNNISNFYYCGVQLDNGISQATNNQIVSNRIFRTMKRENSQDYATVGVIIEDSSEKNLVAGNYIHGNVNQGVRLVKDAKRNLIAFNKIKDCGNTGILAYKPGEGNLIVSNDIVDTQYTWSVFFYEKDFQLRYKTIWLNNYYGDNYLFLRGGNILPFAIIKGYCNEKDEEFQWPTQDVDIYPSTKQIFRDEDFPWV